MSMPRQVADGVTDPRDPGAVVGDPVPFAVAHDMADFCALGICGHAGHYDDPLMLTQARGVAAWIDRWHPWDGAV